MPTLFDFLNDLTFNKNDILTEDNEKDFSPYVVLKGLSNWQQSLHIAEYVNRMKELNKRMTYDFLLYTLPKFKTRGKWSKKEEVDEQTINDIMLYYPEVSFKQAEEISKILKPNEIKEIREFIKTAYGGRL